MSVEQLFNIDSGLFSMNAILEFPEDKRVILLTALEASANYGLPFADEIYQARANGGHAEWLIENKFGDAADHFAKLIDPTFQGFRDSPDPEHQNSQETTRLRGIYYKMIRHLDAGKILEGIRQIRERHLVPENPQS